MYSLRPSRQTLSVRLLIHSALLQVKQARKRKIKKQNERTKSRFREWIEPQYAYEHTGM